MAFNKAAAAWLVSLSEPLVPTLERVVAEDALVSAAMNEPAACRWWFGGVVADHMLTLPDDDPWRSLSARIGALTTGSLPRPPALTGATGPNGRFGDLEDCTDVAPVVDGLEEADPALAAVRSGLSDTSAALLAFASRGHMLAVRAMDELHRALEAESRDAAETARGVVGAGIDALRWAAWRRRVYTGPADDLTTASGFAWLFRAELGARAGELTRQEWDDVAATVEQSTIESGSWRMLAG